jgi:hypothetical protein
MLGCGNNDNYFDNLIIILSTAIENGSLFDTCANRCGRTSNLEYVAICFPARDTK